MSAGQFIVMNRTEPGGDFFALAPQAYNNGRPGAQGTALNQ
jgi:hypothetical protein